jgi:hypothetical protein
VARSPSVPSRCQELLSFPVVSGDLLCPALHGSALLALVLAPGSSAVPPLLFRRLFLIQLDAAFMGGHADAGRRATATE